MAPRIHKARSITTTSRHNMKQNKFKKKRKKNKNRKKKLPMILDLAKVLVLS